jgi:hypothetical protein
MKYDERCYCNRWLGAVSTYCAYGGCVIYRCNWCGGITRVSPHPRCEKGGCGLVEKDQE